MATKTAEKYLGLPVHPDAGLFPLIEGDEFKALVEDIRNHGGLREPIVLLDGAILDGRNRARALEALGMKPATVKGDGFMVEAELRGKTPAEYVASLNLRRRHLTPAMVRKITGELALRIEQEQDDGRPNSEKVNATEAAAKAMNVSKATAARGKAEVKAERGEKPKNAGGRPKLKLVGAEAERERKRAAKANIPDVAPMTRADADNEYVGTVEQAATGFASGMGMWCFEHGYPGAKVTLTIEAKDGRTVSVEELADEERGDRVPTVRR